MPPRVSDEQRLATHQRNLERLARNKAGNKLRILEFVQWLHAQEDDKVLGLAGDPYRCPLATYLRQMHNGVPVFIGARYYIVLGNREVSPRYRHQFSTVHFVRELDKLKGHEVTKREALDAIPKSLAGKNKGAVEPLLPMPGEEEDC